MEPRRQASTTNERDRHDDGWLPAALPAGTLADRDWLAEVYETRGLPVAVVAALADTHPDAVRAALDAAGIERRWGRRDVLSPPLLERWTQTLGWTPEEIARRTGHRASAVLAELHLAGLPTAADRRPGTNRAGGAAADPAPGSPGAAGGSARTSPPRAGRPVARSAAAVADAFAAGATVAQLAARFELSPLQTINRLRAAGAHRRPPDRTARDVLADPDWLAAHQHRDRFDVAAAAGATLGALDHAYHAAGITPPAATARPTRNRPPRPVWATRAGRDRRILAAYRDGATVVEIAARLGVPAGTVRSVVTRAGLHRRPAGRPAPALLADRAWLAGHARRDPRDIAVDLGVPVDQVEAALVGHDLRSPGPAAPPDQAPGGPLEPTREQLVRRFVTDGATLAECAADFGVAPRRMAALLRDHGVHRRPAGVPLWQALTPDTVRDLVAGRGVRETAAHFGATEAAIRGCVGLSQGVNPGPVWLHHEYVVRGRGLADIGEELGVTRERVRQLCALYEISVEDKRAEHPRDDNYGFDPDQLRRDYVERGLTVAELAAQHDAPAYRVSEALARYRIRRPLAGEDVLTRTYLTDAYVHQGRSLAAIAADVGVHQMAVARALRRFGIPVRARWARRLALSDDEIRAALTTETPQQLADRFGVTVSAVHAHMTRLGIKNATPARPGRPGRDELAAAIAAARTLDEVGARYQVTHQTVSRWAAELGLRARAPRDRDRYPGPPAWDVRQGNAHHRALTGPVLAALYVDAGRSAGDIAALLSRPGEPVSGHDVVAALGAHRIRVRTGWGDVLSRAFLARRAAAGATAADIAAEVGTNTVTVVKYQRRWGLPEG